MPDAAPETADEAKPAKASTRASKPAAEAETPEAAPDPQRVIIEQAPAEPAVHYGDDAQVPGSHSATDPNKPHVKARYEPFGW